MSNDFDPAQYYQWSAYQALDPFEADRLPLPTIVSAAKDWDNDGKYDEVNKTFFYKKSKKNKKMSLFSYL